MPGFPKWAFALLAVVIVGLGVAMHRLRERGRSPAWITHRDGSGAPEGDAALDVIAAPLAVRLSGALRHQIDRPALDRALGAVKASVEAELGPVFPRLAVHGDDTLADDVYTLLVQDVVVAEGRLRPGRRLLDPAAPADGIAGAEPAEPFGPYARVVWVAHAPPGARAWTCEEVLSTHVDHVVRRHGALAIGLQEVQWMLRLVQRDAPELAAETARIVPAQRMADVLRRLLDEGIPVRNLNAICESLVKRVPTEPDNIALTELVRIDLGRFITSRHVGARRELAAILFESSLLERVQQAIERTPRGNMLLLSPAVKQDIREQVRGIVGPVGDRTVAITSADVRRYMKTLLEPVAPQLAVLSYQELDEDVSLQPVGWVTNPKAA